MKKIIPSPLKKGDMIRIIAPSKSTSSLTKKIMNDAYKVLRDLGFRITFGEHVNETDLFSSSKISSRVKDFESAFRDNEVKAILALRGGYNANQLLNYIDWNFIKENPKIFCGFSDITVLLNAIFAKTGLTTFSTPNFSSFGQKKYLEYTVEYFKMCLTSDRPFELFPSNKWADNEFVKNPGRSMNNGGFIVIKVGRAKGTIIGGNLCSFNLLQGTSFFPSPSETVLFLEEDDLAGIDTANEFDRNLESLIQQNNVSGIKAIVIGRFQVKSKITREKIATIIGSKRELSTIPIIANVDFGHTNPRATFPVGGTAEIIATPSGVKIRISKC